MLSQQFIEDLSQRAAALFSDAEQFHEDAQARLQRLLQSAFAGLNLVSREEFDAQVAVLEHAEAAIRRLEARVAELEAAGHAQGSDSD